MAVADGQDAVAQEAALIGELGDPAFLGFEVHIAAEHLLVLEVRTGGEVAEVQLADVALEAEADLVLRTGRPGQQQARLGVIEALFLIGVTGLGDGRGLEPQSAFDIQIRPHAPGRLAEQFAAGLLDHDLVGRQGNDDPAIGERLVDFQHVVGDLAAGLEREGRRPFPAHQRPQDGFGGVAVGGEALLGAGDAVGRRQGGGGVLEIVPLADQAGFRRQAFRHRAGEDGADLAARALFGEAVVAQDRRPVLETELAVVVDPQARGQVDLAAHEGVGEIDPHALPAAGLVAVIALVAQDDAVGVAADDAADAVGVINGHAVGQGEAPDTVAVAPRELVGSEAAIGAALEEGHIGRQDLLGAGLGPGDDVHDDRIALHVDAGGPAPDQLDAFDLGHQGSREDRGAGVVLGRRPRAVDQDVTDRAFEAARAVAVLDRETRDPADHVQSRVRALAGEEVECEDKDALLGGAGLRRGSGRGSLGRGRAGAEQDGRRRQQDGLRHCRIPLVV